MSRACLRPHLVDSIKNDLPLFIPTTAFLFQFTDTHLVGSVGQSLRDRDWDGSGRWCHFAQRVDEFDELPTKVVQTRPESLSLDVVTLTWYISLTRAHFKLFSSR